MFERQLTPMNVDRYYPRRAVLRYALISEMNLFGRPFTGRGRLKIQGSASAGESRVKMKKDEVQQYREGLKYFDASGGLRCDGSQHL